MQGAGTARGLGAMDGGAAFQRFPAAQRYSLRPDMPWQHSITTVKVRIICQWVRSCAAPSQGLHGSAYEQAHTVHGSQLVQQEWQAKTAHLQQLIPRLATRESRAAKQGHAELCKTCCHGRNRHVASLQAPPPVLPLLPPPLDHCLPGHL